MTIDEAIKRLTNQANSAWNEDKLKDADACQLGIEALKAWKYSRQTSSIAHFPLLLGETKD